MPSSVIAHFIYQAATETLIITFVSGLVYAYNEVPEEIYLGLKNSKSKGIYFNKFIKDHYHFEHKKRPE